jgi:putative DNA primase/helicase
MASLGYWQEHFADRPCRQNQNPIPDWTRATSHLIETANLCGVYNLDRTRGLGVWIDEGKVVWHLGDRLEVDGCLMPLEALHGRYYYARLPELPIDTSVDELTDSEGIAILEVLKGMGWQGHNDAIHLAGWVVISNVGGALPKRPGLQLTSSSGSGKGDCIDHVIKPLQAELGVYTSGSTEAGLRQQQKHNCLPAIIDESEQEDSRKRKNQLLLVRLSYDGMDQLKGNQNQDSHSFTVRYSIGLVGINAEIPNAADRNRMVVVGRRQISHDAWSALAEQRAKLITLEVGRRLVRRIVTHLKTLLHNIDVFAKILKRDYDGRAGDTHAPILAGSFLLCSTEKVDEEGVHKWIQVHGWFLDQDTRDVCSAVNESEQCFEHMLSYEERCSNSGIAPNGLVSIRELLAICLRQGFADPLFGEAKTLLGRLAIKVDKEKGVLIATSGKGKLPEIFAQTRWANGAYMRRLEDLPGVTGKAGSFHIPVLGTQRCMSIPIELFNLSKPMPD